MDAFWHSLGRTVALLVLAAVVAGCATAPPVQEMSDARQAIAAARDAGAAQYAQPELKKAEEELAMAESQLRKRVGSAYWQARQAAIRAKETAFEALLKSRSAREAATP